MKLFFLRLNEQNGEQEYSYDHIVEAENLNEAQKKAEIYASNFYGKADEMDEKTDKLDEKTDKLIEKTDKLDEKIFWFFGGCIAINISDLYETTKEEFLEKIYQNSFIT